MYDPIRAITSPFEKGLLRVPDPGRGFFIRAETSPTLSNELRRALICEQTFKPANDRLVAAGFRTVVRLTGLYQTGLCVLTKHKAENFVNIARAWNFLEPGGVLVCAGAKDVGAASIERRTSAALGQFRSVVKFHCRTFWIEKSVSGATQLPTAWSDLESLRPNVEGNYLTCPGVFSWKKIDEGSRLLVDSLPRYIEGEVADFGAGWGYLSVMLAKKFPNISRLDLYEAEMLSLLAAKENLRTSSSIESINFFWHDLLDGKRFDQNYDFVVMNPPFHNDKGTSVALGQGFIISAAKALRPGGWLLMVANRQLAYEGVLEQMFTVVQKRIETSQFKVFFARL